MGRTALFGTAGAFRLLHGRLRWSFTQQPNPAPPVRAQPIPALGILVLFCEALGQVVDILLLSTLDEVNESLLEGSLHEQIHARHDYGSSDQQSCEYLDSDRNAHNRIIQETVAKNVHIGRLTRGDEYESPASSQVDHSGNMTQECTRATPIYRLFCSRRRGMDYSDRRPGRQRFPLQLIGQDHQLVTCLQTAIGDTLTHLPQPGAASSGTVAGGPCGGRPRASGEGLESRRRA